MDGEAFGTDRILTLLRRRVRHHIAPGKESPIKITMVFVQTGRR